MKSSTKIMDTLCFLIALGVILYVNVTIKAAKKTLRDDEEIRLTQNGMLAVGFVLWPIIWNQAIGYEKLVEHPRMIVGFLWPLILTLFEIQYVEDFNTGTSDDKKTTAMFNQRNLAADTQAIISVAFAMGSLYFSTSKNANTTHLIMLALVICLAIILPNLEVPPESKENIFWHSGQRIALNYAIGWSISGISLDLLKNLFQEGKEKIDVMEIKETKLGGGKDKLVFREINI